MKLKLHTQALSLCSASVQLAISVYLRHKTNMHPHNPFHHLATLQLLFSAHAGLIQST